MSAAHFGLENLVAFVDVNNQQADGSPEQVMGLEPVELKWAAFGWGVHRVDGNSLGQIVLALERAKSERGLPHAIILDTQMGKGVPLFERREKNHFIRVEPDEWATARRQLEGVHG